MGRSPFRDGEEGLVVICTHHRVGTVWFHNVFNAIAAEYGLSCRKVNRGKVTAHADILLDQHSEVDLSRLPPFRGLHIIRDPRDIVVSGFFYHQWSKESWLKEPWAELGGRTYQEHLCALPPAEGLSFEMEHVSAKTIRDMLKWDYTNPAFHEIRYEDLLQNEDVVFSEIFHFLGFRKQADSLSICIADRFSFNRLTGRQLGEVRAGSHLRSGQIGQWRNIFTSAQKKRFTQLFPDALKQLSYETSDDW